MQRQLGTLKQSHQHQQYRSTVQHRVGRLCSAKQQVYLADTGSIKLQVQQRKSQRQQRFTQTGAEGFFMRRQLRLWPLRVKQQQLLQRQANTYPTQPKQQQMVTQQCKYHCRQRGGQSAHKTRLISFVR